MQKYFFLVDGLLKATGDKDVIEAARAACPIDSNFEVIFGRALQKTEVRKANVKYPYRRKATTAAKKTKPARKIMKKKTTIAHNQVAQ